ncbi:MAG: polysaccharide biosynthesis protein [Bacteroidota bacterium]
MLKLKSATPRWIIVIVDLFLSVLALGWAYFIRFDMDTNLKAMKNEWIYNWKEFLVFLVIKFAVFYLFKIHLGLVRFTSTQDLKRLLSASLACTMVFIVISAVRSLIFDTTYLFPSSILLMEFVFSLLFLTGSRFTLKLWYLESIKNQEPAQKIVIFGAGSMGLIAKRTIENDQLNPQRILGFLDDNPKLTGKRIDGITVFTTSEIERLHQTHQLEAVVVAIRNPAIDRLNSMVDYCLANAIKIQRVQDPETWVNGELTVKKIRKISIDELLGREEIQLNQDELNRFLTGKTVLITGAAGSIGSGITKELAQHFGGKLILVDQAESPMYDLQQELWKHEHLQFIIGDIRDGSFLENLFAEHTPNVVFHAAAYKHVPLMEENPQQAITTNIQGTKNLVDLALKFNVEKFVFISTDKAVNPTNVMGASKRIAEMYVQSKGNHGPTAFITTRFGNVLGSNGSVIPLFQKQIDAGGPVLVTDPEITRFFMTIPEACQLVLEAFVMGTGGEIYVFDMGKSVKILDLAEKMIRLHGLEPYQDISIQFSGLRPGEKLYEELLANEETTLTTHHPKILIAKTRENDPEFMKSFDDLLDDQYELLEKVSFMKKMVPEFISNNSRFETLDRG